jgi:hypothetical protein
MNIYGTRLRAQGAGERGKVKGGGQARRMIYENRVDLSAIS